MCVCVLVNCLAMHAPHTGTALEIVDLAAEIDRSKFVKNVKPNVPFVSSSNFLNGGGAIVYNGIERARTGNPLPPLAVSRSSFVKNEAFGPGGAIIAYSVPEPFDFQGRVRFRRNVSVQNATLNDFADVDLP